jgi:hypothetical protein
MRRLLGCSIALVAVALCVVSPVVAAGKPEIIHERFVGVDDEASAGLSEFCGFEVVVFVDVRATERRYADGSERDTVNERITYTAGDQQLFEHNRFQFYFDAQQEISRFTGMPFRVVDESGRVIFKDRGNAAFDSEGNILWEHGPHPSLHDPTVGGICRDLSE